MALTEADEEPGQREDPLIVQVGRLVEQFHHFNLEMDRHDGRLRSLDADAYETRYVLNLGSHLARALRSVRRIVPADLDNLAAAYRAGEIGDSEWDDIHRLDVLAVGRPVKGLAADPEGYYAIELSLVVDESDVDRAARRAAILQSHGVNAAPAVDGRAITSDAEQKASELGVEVLVRKVQPAA